MRARITPASALLGAAASAPALACTCSCPADAPSLLRELACGILEANLAPREEYLITVRRDGAGY